jgi:putative endonuclease
MSPSNDPRARLGRLAEQRVADYLAQSGFTLLARNARQGRLELDLIARRSRLVVFCEVRSRSHAGFISPVHTITPVKIARLRQAAAMWLREAALGSVDVRFDVASVVFDVPGGRLEYYEAAFQ